MAKIRKLLYPNEATLLGYEPKENLKDRNQNRYYVSPEEWEFILHRRQTPNEREFVETVRKLDKNGNVTSTIEKLQSEPIEIPENFEIVKISTSKTTGQQWIQYKPKQVDYTDYIEDSIDNVLNRFSHLKTTFKPQEIKAYDKALKVTTSDDHVGLEPNPNGNSIFNYEYNAKIYQKSYNKVFHNILKEHNTHGKFDLLLLDNLGDEQDGWNKRTTRGEHELDQNMTNAEVFETCVDVKVNFITSLVKQNVANKIILRKVVNDNHSGDFGHTINIAVKKIINLLYSQDVVEVETLTQFLEHRTYGDHCFILTHGKDTKQMFKGLPLLLNDKTINFINDYIRFYNIKSKYIHVEKGDLHQIGYNKCNTFDYRNFMSFAPPSSWVQHNFGDCYSGYSIQVVPKHNNEISHTDYFLDYKKIN